MLLEVFKRQGIQVPDYRVMAFDSLAITNKMSEVISVWREVYEPNPMTVIGFALDPHYPQFTQHFGVCLDKRKFIHTRKHTGGVIEDINSPFWSRKRTGYWEWQG